MLFIELIQLSERQTDRQTDRQTNKQTDRQTGRQIKRRDRPAEENTRSLNIASLVSNHIDGPADVVPRESHLTASLSTTYETAFFQRLLSPSRFSSHCFSLLLTARCTLRHSSTSRSSRSRSSQGWSRGANYAAGTPRTPCCSR